jgi:hypothetical protein
LENLFERNNSQKPEMESKVTAPKYPLGFDGKVRGGTSLDTKEKNQRYLLLKSDEDPVIKARAIRSVNINEFPDIIIQALNDPSCQIREAALKKLIELDDDLYAKKLEQDIASLLAVENHDDVLISILEYYDYYYFSEPQSIVNIGAQLISKSELSEDVLIHIIKILSSYDIPTDSIDHLVTSSSSFLNLSLSAKEIVRKETERFFKE